jgi:hypothetical protein
MAFAEHMSAFFADFAVTATAGSVSAGVIVDRETPDAFTDARTTRLIMSMIAGALSLDVGDSLTLTGDHAGSYKVLDVDAADGAITRVTLGVTSA